VARTASTTALTQAILQGLKSGNFPSEVVIDFFDGTSFQRIEDFDESAGIKWGKSAKRYKYANIPLTPLVPKCSFTVKNIKGKYSEGSGTSVANIFKLDTKIKIRAGYILKDKSEIITQTISLNNSTAIFFYTKHNVGGYVELDAANSGGLLSSANLYFDDFFNRTYDSFKYDAKKYTPAGYWLNTFDLEGAGFVDPIDIKITANNTKGTIFFRLINSLSDVGKPNGQSTTFQNGGATVNGTVTVPVNGKGRYIQIGIVIDGVTWSDDIRINNVTFTYNKKIEFIYKQVFYLDTPTFTEPTDPEIPKVKISARGIYKRATEDDINLEDVSGDTLEAIIKSVATKIGIKFSATSIAVTGIANRNLTAGLGDVEKGDSVFQKIMQIANKKSSSKFQLFMEHDDTIDDDILFLQKKPTDLSATFVQSYLKFNSIGDQRKNYDNLLKRLTVISDNKILAAEVQLDQDTILASGTYTASWTGNAQYKRFTIVNNAGDGVATLTDVTPTSLVFSITGASVNLTITTFGSRWSSGEPSAQGEFINQANLIAGSGQTARIINPLVNDDAEAKDIAEGLLIDFGNPVKEAKNLIYPYLDLLQEINDPNALWTRWVFIDDIFFITGVQYAWDRKPNSIQTTTLNLDDSGTNLFDEGAIIYDRDKAPNSGSVVKYDKGFVYNMSFSPQQDPSTIDTSTAVYPLRSIGYSNG